MSLLVDEMEGFLRAGGMVTYGEWDALDTETKAALIAAQKRIQVDNAHLFSLALEGEAGRAKMAYQYDGGAALARLGLDAVVDNYIRKNK